MLSYWLPSVLRSRRPFLLFALSFESTWLEAGLGCGNNEFVSAGMAIFVTRHLGCRFQRNTPETKHKTLHPIPRERATPVVQTLLLVRKDPKIPSTFLFPFPVIHLDVAGLSRVLS